MIHWAKQSADLARTVALLFIQALQSLEARLPDRLLARARPIMQGEKWLLMRAADFVLLPSRFEPCGLVDVEFGWQGALGCGFAMVRLSRASKEARSMLHVIRETAGVDPSALCHRCKSICYSAVCLARCHFAPLYVVRVMVCWCHQRGGEMVLVSLTVSRSARLALEMRKIPHSRMPPLIHDSSLYLFSLLAGRLG